MIEMQNRVLLAPMSGITDLPFRRLVHRLGAGLVVAEMVNERMLTDKHKQTLQRITKSSDISPHVIQISGHDPLKMAQAAVMAADLGADMIDINMGCPARKVVGALGGSALMRQPGLALAIVEHVIGAVGVPVSLKMRLGWDEDEQNAPQLARQAEQAGIAMFTIHGRTRSQFYEGRADWQAIGEVVQAVKAPVIANGDILSLADARQCLAQSGAYGVMIGRGAQGRPWLVGQIGQELETGRKMPDPSIGQKRQIMIEHYEDMLRFYGDEAGLRNARKHLGWYVHDLIKEPQQADSWRRKFYREDHPARVMALISKMFAQLSCLDEVVS